MFILFIKFIVICIFLVVFQFVLSRLSSFIVKTERQSVVKYHQQFEQDKGHYVGSAVDKSMESARAAANLASGVKYKQPTPAPTSSSSTSEPTKRQIFNAPTEPKPVHLSEPQQPEAPAAVAQPSGELWVALYDYDADADDEVSFKEGDVIIDVNPIDDGWAEVIFYFILLIAVICHFFLPFRALTLDWMKCHFRNLCVDREP